jgi:hypothetical protein
VRVAALDVDGLDLDQDGVSPFWVLGDDGTLTPRGAGLSAASSLADADVAALPAHWSSYAGPLRRRAVEALGEAAAAGLDVVVWVDGDHEVDLGHPAALLFEQGPTRGRPRTRAWPVLIHDHLAQRFDDAVDPVPRGDRPTVGFCGQATAGPAGRARLLAGKARMRVAHAGGRSDRLAAPWASHLRLRQRALAVLAAHPGVDADVVVRDRYRAGLREVADRRDRSHPTSTEFFANIRANAYTLCVRGGGNFSTRFYETLCLGRIPVLVDSGAALPWEGRVPWSELAVVVPADALDELADRVVAHHAALDDEAFAAAQVACRDVWLERLSVPGFFGHVAELLS